MNVYHYTSLEGLLGIIKSHSLWATNIYFLNDKQESYHGCKCFRNTVIQLSGDVISEENKPILLKALDIYENESDLSKNLPLKHVYSISFCKDDDKLSQWRGYGSKQGISIGFDKDKLIDFVGNVHLNCMADEIIYTSEKETVQMSKKLKDFFGSSQRGLLNEMDHFATLTSTYSHLSKLIPFFKDSGFSEEDEFRLVFTPYICLPEVHFRVNNNGLVPYIILHNDTLKYLPIKTITLGPTKDYDFVKSGVRMLLDSQGYNNVDIKESNIPYRD